jgi:OmcA/MtrC family decaheme c-type cytochrome
MSKKVPKIKSFLTLLSLLLFLVFFAGCADDGDNGRDGTDADPAVTDDLQAQIDELVAANEELQAELEAAGAGESCAVCHGEDRDWDVAAVHTTNDAVLTNGDLIATVTGITETVGGILTVAFSVEDQAAAGVAGLLPSRIYAVDIVPAGVGENIYDTDYPERWAYERADSTGLVAQAGYSLGTWTDLTGGDYTYEMAIAVGGDADNDVVDPLVDEPDNDPTDGDYAADFARTNTQRVVMRLGADGYNNAVLIQDFVLGAAAGDAVTLADPARVLAPTDGCKKCHSDRMEEAAHAGGYLDTRACVVCHSPIGHYGEEMLADDAWLTALIHKIHSAIEMPAFDDRYTINGEDRSYDAVTYPQDPKDCAVCHTGNENMTDAWQTNPTKEACGTCHVDVDFATGVGHGPSDSGASGGAQATNEFCVACHPDTGDDSFGGSITAVHDVTITPAYTTTITLSADANADAVYEAGEEILVTVTVTGATGDYDGAAVGAGETGFTKANLYVYGPRAEAVPVLATGSTTDPAYVAGTLPTQSHNMMVGGTDAQVMTDADGFKYQLLAIPEDLEPGTYMVMAYVTHTSSSGFYRTTTGTDGWALTTIQIGTATEEEKIAGDGCNDCHQQSDGDIAWGSMYHRSYFGTDGCIGCHDKSGNHADPIANRVHAVHAASATGDLLAADWSEITYPQDSANCVTCHDSGNDSYLTNPLAQACQGCHGDNDGAKNHMILNGADFPAEE